MDANLAMSRRGALLGAGALLLGASAARAQANSFERRAGVQLWTVNAEIQKDVEGTLKRIRQIGYERVETAGYAGRTPAEFAAAVKAAGLVCDSVHHNAGDLMADLPGKIAAAQAMGASWLVCSSPNPTTPPKVGADGSWNRAMGRAMSADDWKRNIAFLAEAAPKVRAAGLQLAYHNHAMEFAEAGGIIPMEEIIKAGVRAELDVGWAAVAGADPVAFLRKHAGKVDLLHVKDIATRPNATGPEPASTEVGRGVVDWPAVFAAARATGVRSWFVEQEAPYRRPPFESLAISYEYVRKL
ncbi:sugar phosphate isomerase/epimerase family protein [Phenylobacterium deserti]|uniref:Sugar phosphate isomerase/epimerase n=1 Tax=Phenylobacterium deserti TaxID=1914756 RepID=A0A328A8F2_9CAUL|nr:sugar phosphate isomerase/epimerase [Phenylobacterium deserti]RAK50749.1 sugar phosphate isomerase/epimerase [Phenylobacterium deserti]